MRLLLLIIPLLAHAAEWQPITVVATAYCPCRICCGERAVGLTADGSDTDEEPYGIAADPRTFPYGTVLWIPTGSGYLDRYRSGVDDRFFEVDDTGGIIRRRTRATGIPHIDLRFKSHASARKFGVKTITIYVWRD